MTIKVRPSGRTLKKLRNSEGFHILYESRWSCLLPETSLFQSHSKLSAKISSYGIFREIGTQTPSYSSTGHIAVLNELLNYVVQKEIPPDLKTVLTQFPPSFQKIIELSRMLGIHMQPEKIKLAVQTMTQEILGRR